MPHRFAPTSLIVAALLLGAPALTAQTFSNPTEITNAFAPFRPEAVKVFWGRSEGARTTTIVRHLDEPRDFSWNAGTVSCCVREERTFEDGQLVEVAHTYLAQDDAGNVHAFGEVSLLYEEGDPVDVEEDSWVVGDPLPSDPEGIESADDPAMFMPATLEVGQSFDMDPEGTEQITVLAVGKKLKVRAGKYTSAVKLREVNTDEGGKPETTWVVPGIGIVKELDVDGRQQLIATSLLELDAGALESGW